MSQSDVEWADVHRPCLVCARELTPEETVLCARCDLLEPRLEPDIALEELRELVNGA